MALPFFGIGMKTDIFQSCGHCWVFQMCWHIECSTLTASSFRIWNSSTGIPSPPLALFIVILSKSHLTSHSRMSGSRWVITPSWLSGSWRSFFYNSSVCSFHLFLISSASVRSIPFLLYSLCQNLWLCRSQQTVENFPRNGNTRPLYLTSEKSLCRVKEQQLELDTEQHTGLKLGKA